MHFLVNVVDMPAVCAMRDAHGPDRAEGPWRFHNCKFGHGYLHARSCATTSVHGPDCADARGDSTVAVLGQGCWHARVGMPVAERRHLPMVLTVQKTVEVRKYARCCSTTGAHGRDFRYPQGKLCGSPRRFHRCSSWLRLLTFSLLCNNRCLEARGDSSGAVLG